uniref:ubiquitinyl hydrolase 1 n=1 Tax=Clastoptera arizonana TaxID=38151 RepID=A0A1B6CS39_9HEMI
MSDTKWQCNICTFKNVAASVKCSMCYNLKGDCIQDESEDIEEMFFLHGPSDSSQEVPQGQSSGSEDNYVPKTWKCELCGYFNWNRPRSEGCDDCNYVKEMAKNATERMRGKVSSKWTCPVCTFENLATNLFCKMCNIPAVDNVLPQEDEISLERDENSLAITNTKDNSDNLLGAAPLPNNNVGQRLNVTDWPWLNACLGIVEGDYSAIEAFLASGGDPTRQLTHDEVLLLNRPSAFDTGYTLIHLAIRFQRDQVLPTLLTRIKGSGRGVKKVPSTVVPELASDIRQHVASSIRQKKSPVPCSYFSEITTFSLPLAIEDLPKAAQEKLFEELLDTDAQETLEEDPAVINWSHEVTVQLGSRLYALWNRSSGDCLLDSVMQTTWGVFDKDNMLRKALADTMVNCGDLFYTRWREYESYQALSMEYCIEETQWDGDWTHLMYLASHSGSSLENLHVFILAQILRRPIIVYSVKYVKNYRGEDLDLARYEGVFLPIVWEKSFCSRSPLALGYTRGHFSALVAFEPLTSKNENKDGNLQIIFLPLMDKDRKLLPIHFLVESEKGRDEATMREWMDVCVTDEGLVVAQQTLTARPEPVAQMLGEWLNYYRRLVLDNSANSAQPSTAVNASVEATQTSPSNPSV